MCRAGICGIAGRRADSQIRTDHLANRSADKRSPQASAPPADRLLPPSRRETCAAFPTTSWEIPSSHSYAKTLHGVVLGVNRIGMVRGIGADHVDGRLIPAVGKAPPQGL